jgi:hypothetical protein
MTMIEAELLSNLDAVREYCANSAEPSLLMLCILVFCSTFTPREHSFPEIPKTDGSRQLISADPLLRQFAGESNI